MEDDGFYFPTVSEKLMNRLQVLSQAMAGNIHDRNTSEVVYYLQDMKNNSSSPIGAILVLSHFSAIHESASQEISDLLINEVSKDITSENSLIVEACMIGLKAICGNYIMCFMDRKFSQILKTDYGENIVVSSH